MDLAVGDETVRQADRLEDVLGDVGLEFVPTDDLDHPAEDLVVRVRVLPCRTGRGDRSDRDQPVDPPRQLVGPAGVVREGRVALQGGETARVAQQLA